MLLEQLAATKNANPPLEAFHFDPLTHLGQPIGVLVAVKPGDDAAAMFLYELGVLLREAYSNRTSPELDKLRRYVDVDYIADRISYIHQNHGDISLALYCAHGDLITPAMMRGFTREVLEHYEA